MLPFPLVPCHVVYDVPPSFFFFDEGKLHESSLIAERREIGRRFQQYKVIESNSNNAAKTGAGHYETKSKVPSSYFAGK